MKHMINFKTLNCQVIVPCVQSQKNIRQGWIQPPPKIGKNMIFLA